jgi:hypothetical protein
MKIELEKEKERERERENETLFVMNQRTILLPINNCMTMDLNENFKGVWSVGSRYSNHAALS